MQNKNRNETWTMPKHSKQSGKQSNAKTTPSPRTADKLAGYSDKGTVPAKARKATQKRKLREYICPHCGESVTSTVQTGQVDHRCRCGNQFRVKDERIVEKAYVYMCIEASAATDFM